MPTQQPRSYDEYQKLKQEKNLEITENNASEVLKASKIKTVKLLKTLQVGEIRQVEDLYLTIAQLTHAASYVAAKNIIKTNKNKTFNVALNSVDADDVNDILQKTFGTDEDKNNFSKFIAIDMCYKPGKEAWAGLHDKMTALASQELKTTLERYQAHLKKKLQAQGIDMPIAGNDQVNHSTYLNKLVKRYEAIRTLNQNMHSKRRLQQQDFSDAQKAIKTCIDNKPTWPERPFIHKLIDLLSLGIKPLYRTFFSKEDEFKKTLDDYVDTPKMEK